MMGKQQGRAVAEHVEWEMLLQATVENTICRNAFNSVLSCFMHMNEIFISKKITLSLLRPSWKRDHDKM